MRDKPTYLVELSVPGAHGWCREVKQSMTSARRAMTRSPEFAGGAAVLPRVGIADHDGCASLELSWESIPAESARDALERAHAVLDLAAPSLADSPGLRALVAPTGVAG